MNLDEDVSSFIERIPSSSECCFCVPLRAGTKIIAILGIVMGLTCGAMLIIKDRKYLTVSSIILISLLSIFIIITLMFVAVSVLLLVAACDENPDLMSYYIWLAVVYLCVQLILAIVIPIVLAFEGKQPIAVALLWMVAVMIIALGSLSFFHLLILFPGWAHFISVVNTFRMNLIYGNNI